MFLKEKLSCHQCVGLKKKFFKNSVRSDSKKDA